MKNKPLNTIKRIRKTLFTLIFCGGLSCPLFGMGSQAKTMDKQGAAKDLPSKNIFAPYLNDEAPKIVETISKEVKDGIEITKFKFINRVIPETNEKVIIYGILAKPVKEGKYPGLLFCHGSGGRATDVWVLGWAKKGYVALIVDAPGISNMSKAKSTGPWSKLDWKCFRLDKSEGTENPLFDGIVANLNALSLLRSRPDVDKNKVGVAGVSCGGYMTTIISGIAGDRVKASFAIYGCGYYDLGSEWTRGIKRMKPELAEKWLETFDAGRWAPKIKSEFFSFPASNDWYFWLPAVIATYDEIKSPKNIAICPNKSHQLGVPGGKPIRNPYGYGYIHLSSMEIQWMDYHLKGEGKPFPKCFSSDKSEREGANVKVLFKVDAPEKLKETSVWYSLGERPWRNRRWRKLDTKDEGDGKYSALIPVYEPECPIDWYGLVSDSRDITVTTTLQRIEPLKQGFKAEERIEVSFSENFESPEARKKWGFPFASRFKNGKYRISKEFARNSKMGLSLTGEIVFRCDDIRGEALKKSGAKGISLWTRSKGGTGFEVVLAVDSEYGQRYFWYAPVENPGSDWKKIDLTWDKFKYAGPGSIRFNRKSIRKQIKPAPVTLVSKDLAQFSIATPEKADIYIDDISTIK